MSDEALFTAPPEAPAGMHPAVITSVVPCTIETGEGPLQKVRWTVAIELDDGTVAEPDALSSPIYNNRSKAKRWAVSVGVPKEQKSLVASDLVGRECMAVIGEKQNGDIGLLDILPVPKAKAQKP